jgi:hypothetical protein
MGDMTLPDASLYEKARQQVLRLIERGRIGRVPAHPIVREARLHFETLIRLSALLDSRGRRLEANEVLAMIKPAMDTLLHAMAQERAGRI